MNNNLMNQMLAAREFQVKSLAVAHRMSGDAPLKQSLEDFKNRVVPQQLKNEVALSAFSVMLYEAEKLEEWNLCIILRDCVNEVKDALKIPR